MEIETVGLQASGIRDDQELAQIRHGPLREAGNGIASGGQHFADISFAERPMTFQIDVTITACAPSAISPHTPNARQYTAYPIHTHHSKK